MREKTICPGMLALLAGLLACPALEAAEAKVKRKPSPYKKAKAACMAENRGIQKEELKKCIQQKRRAT